MEAAPQGADGTECQLRTIHDNLGGGRELQDRGDIRILTTDSRGYMAGTNTVLQSNYPPIKKKFLKRTVHEMPRSGPFPGKKVQRMLWS